MRHTAYGPGRHSPETNDLGDHSHRRHGRHHRGGRHGGRLFDYGDLRVLLLAIIADRPSHGYELIKTIEERFGGSYSPSPGVIYPTLAWLDDMGYAVIEVEGDRKRYRITPEGESFLAANRTAADELLSRAGSPDRDDHVPAPLVRAMENLKIAMRLRLRRGPVDQATAESIASALDAAAQLVERS